MTVGGEGGQQWMRMVDDGNNKWATAYVVDGGVGVDITDPFFCW
jgi:hypothetical protein